jgi:hypothetical protein
VAGALDGLLSQWRDHLVAVPGTDDEDSAALVMWPSRDITGIRTLLRHGLVPMEGHRGAPNRDRFSLVLGSGSIRMNGGSS